MRRSLAVYNYIVPTITVRNMMLYSAQYMTLAQKRKKVRYTLVHIYKYIFSITFVIGVKKQSWHGRFKEALRARNIRSEL